MRMLSGSHPTSRRRLSAHCPGSMKSTWSWRGQKHTPPAPSRLAAARSPALTAWLHHGRLRSRYLWQRHPFWRHFDVIIGNVLWLVVTQFARILCALCAFDKVFIRALFPGNSCVVYVIVRFLKTVSTPILNSYHQPFGKLPNIALLILR